MAKVKFIFPNRGCLEGKQLFFSPRAEQMRCEWTPSKRQICL